jgi:hypothetical protein
VPRFSHTDAVNGWPALGPTCGRRGPYPTVLGRPAPDAVAHCSLGPLSRQPHEGLGENAAAVRASRTNGFALVRSVWCSRTIALDPRTTTGPGRWLRRLGVAISRGEVSSPSTPSISLGAPDVSRLRPVQGRLSKARLRDGLPAQSRSTEHRFGRGRQSADQRITGGLVGHDQSRGVAPADPMSTREGRARAIGRQALARSLPASRTKRHHERVHRRQTASALVGVEVTGRTHLGGSHHAVLPDWERGLARRQTTGRRRLGGAATSCLLASGSWPTRRWLRCRRRARSGLRPPARWSG